MPIAAWYGWLSDLGGVASTVTRTQELHVSAIAVAPYEGEQWYTLLSHLRAADAMVFVRPIGALPSVVSAMGMERSE